MWIFLTTTTSRNPTVVGMTILSATTTSTNQNPPAVLRLGTRPSPLAQVQAKRLSPRDLARFSLCRNERRRANHPKCTLDCRWCQFYPRFGWGLVDAVVHGLNNLFHSTVNGDNGGNIMFGFFFLRHSFARRDVNLGPPYQANKQASNSTRVYSSTTVRYAALLPHCL